MVTAIASPHVEDPRTKDLLESLGQHCPEVLTHGTDVAVLSVRIAHVLGLDEARLTVLARAALLHDIGKKLVPVHILAKPGKLDAEEWALIENHPVTGHRMLVDAGLAAEARIVLHHHERIDGGGYPTGRGGDDIPFESRIIAVADSFDAMTSERPYRAAMTVAAAVAELREVAGKQCDAAAVEALASIVLRAAA
jgi:putative nucleotidyltransferase with HDIG domain